MKPICETVDQASRTLMLMRVSTTMLASTAVARPSNANRSRAASAFSNIGAKRISTKPPRLTTPACSNADTGVGASITWINQPCTGNKAVRSVTASTSKTALACRGRDRPCCAICAHKSVSEPLPTCCQASAVAPSSMTSASRSAIRFLCAASKAKGRSG